MKKMLVILFIFANAFCFSQLPIDTTNVNLFLWLSPDTAVFDVNGDPCNIGDDVYEWYDISGNGWIFKNDENNRRPKFDTIEGSNYLNFSPGNFLQNLTIDNVLNGLTEFTIYIVIKSDDVNTDQGFMDSHIPDGSDANIGLRYDKKGANTGRNKCLKTGMVGNDWRQQVESQANTQTTNRQTLTLAWKQNERLFLFIDGVISDSSDITFNSVISGCNRILLGKGAKDGNLSSGSGWDGKIGDIVFYNKRQSNDSIQQLSEVLPVELINFNGVCNNNIITLSWVTASEINNDYFSLEKSNDGISFTLIGTVSGSDNSNMPIYYSFVDMSDENGYYRIKQVDFDGNYEYFNVEYVSCDNDIAYNIYPNPAKYGEHITVSGNYDHIFITDILGKTIKSVIIDNKIEGLPCGIYIVIIDGYYKTKLIVN